jgi:hypothetical protein
MPERCPICSHYRCISCVEVERGFEEQNLEPRSSDSSQRLVSSTNEDIQHATQSQSQLAPLIEMGDARVRSVLASNLSVPTTLPEVIQDRVWPFYSNWLDQPLGPCTRMAEFDHDSQGSVTAVKIYIICEKLPSRPLQDIIGKCTLDLVPTSFRSNNQVVIEFVEGESSWSTNGMERYDSAARGGYAQLIMGRKIETATEKR